MTAFDVLHDSDFVRGSRRAFGENAPHKEWHHVVVHLGRFRLILNFSLNDCTGDPVRRVIALLRDEKWARLVEAFDMSDCEIRSGRVAACYGPCEFTLIDGAYELNIRLPAIGLPAPPPPAP